VKRTKAIVIGVGIFALIIVILGLLFYYSYTQIHVTLDDASLHSIDFVPFTFSTFLKLGLNALTGNWLDLAFDLVDGINLDLLFGVTNHGLLPVYIPNLSYDLSINGVNVGKGHATIDATIYPGHTQEIPALQNIKKTSFIPAINSIVNNDGIIELRVNGTAFFKLFGQNIPVPFKSTKQISIIDEIKSQLNNQIN
jgi:LEA14-like dessication related protein